MRYRRLSATAVMLFLLLGGSVPGQPVEFGDVPLVTLDLLTEGGSKSVSGTWRYSDVGIREINFWKAGSDGQPGNRSSRTYDIEPHAGPRDFDDSGWEVLSPPALRERRTGGKVSFAWYRFRLAVPKSIDGFDPDGMTLVLEISVDDYAEVWVDGELPRRLGQRGGSVISGWNATNRLVIGRNVHPGQVIQLALFAINGPISAAPTNYVFIRSARLEFHPGGWGPRAVVAHEVNVEVLRLDPDIDELIPKNPKLFKLAEGFEFTEGPVWVPGGRNGGGVLLFSDPNENRIYEYQPDGRLRVFLENSGYAGADVGLYRQPGSNGLALDSSNRLTVAEHGNRRVTRRELDGTLTVLADRYEGSRLNSPNDLAYHSDGTLYFTDPPFGLPGGVGQELPFSGVFRLVHGQLELLVDDLAGPNGIAFSPDERFLYVGNWDPTRKVVMRYPVLKHGSLGPGVVFFDMTDAPQEEAIDGIEVDERGNLFVSGPGGTWVLAPDGRHLGTIIGPRPAHNFSWGGVDGSDLYMTSRDALYRMPMHTRGIRR